MRFDAAQAIPEMIEIATNGVFEDNRKAKHGRDAKKGWYRYDTRFALPVYGDDEPEQTRLYIHKNAVFIIESTERDDNVTLARFVLER